MEVVWSQAFTSDIKGYNIYYSPYNFKNDLSKWKNMNTGPYSSVG